MTASGGDGVLHYAGYGLHLTSDLQLPGLSSWTGSDAEDLTVRGTRLQAPDLPSGSAKQIQPQHAQLYWEGVGQLEVRDGRSIAYCPDPAGAANPGLLAQAILGPATGLALQQRGLFPLHASAIAHEDRAVAMVGPSGTGKSTLAREFFHQGHALITDDIAALQTTGEGVQIEPGLGSFRLWPSSLRTPYYFRLMFG